MQKDVNENISRQNNTEKKPAESYRIQKVKFFIYLCSLMATKTIGTVSKNLSCFKCL